METDLQRSRVADLKDERGVFRGLWTRDVRGLGGEAVSALPEGSCKTEKPFLRVGPE